MSSILILLVSALTVKSYVVNGTIEIIIIKFILTLKNNMSTSKLKKYILILIKSKNKNKKRSKRLKQKQ